MRRGASVGDAPPKVGTEIPSGFTSESALTTVGRVSRIASHGDGLASGPGDRADSGQVCVLQLSGRAFIWRTIQRGALKHPCGARVGLRASRIAGVAGLCARAVGDELVALKSISGAGGYIRGTRVGSAENTLAREFTRGARVRSSRPRVIIGVAGSAALGTATIRPQVVALGAVTHNPRQIARAEFGGASERNPLKRIRCITRIKLTSAVVVVHVSSRANLRTLLVHSQAVTVGGKTWTARHIIAAVVSNAIQTGFQISRSAGEYAGRTIVINIVDAKICADHSGIILGA